MTAACPACGQALPAPIPAPCPAGQRGPQCGTCGHQAMAHDRDGVCLTCLVNNRQTTNTRTRTP